LFTLETVTVVTATTGHSMLGRCLQSVQRQTFARTEHFIVPDGIEHRDKAHQAIRALGDPSINICAMTLPYATGRIGWCGHRIYAAVSMLCNTEYVCFLDDDNWLEPDHIASLVSQIKSTESDWGFSLRNIYDSEGNFIAPDNCESLGSLHPSYTKDSDRLIDTNCFLFRRELAVTIAPLWYRPAPPVGPGADRVVTQYLLQNYPKHCSTRRHTLNYTAGNSTRSAAPEFFVKGNASMKERYPNGLPWENPGKTP
jgi:hypothetical protein